MRVYLVGAHSTGKTTLARFVSKRYGLPLLTEVARSILAERELSIEGLRSDLDLVDSYQAAIFERQVQEESRYKEFVSDRSFDNLAYAAQHARILQSVASSKKLSKYVTTLRSPEAIVFFVRPSPATMKQDGVREAVAWDDIVAIDAMVKLMLEMWGIRYFPMASASLQERSRFVDAVMSLAGKWPRPLSKTR